MKEIVIRSLIVWVFVWPIVTGFLLCVNWLGLAWPMPLQTFILSGVLVPMIGLVIAPRAAKAAAAICRSGTIE
jgi:hypothetical protein